MLRVGTLCLGGSASLWRKSKSRMVEFEDPSHPTNVTLPRAGGSQSAAGGLRGGGASARDVPVLRSPHRSLRERLSPNGESDIWTAGPSQKSELIDASAPGEPGPESAQQDSISLRNSACPQGFVERNRDARRRRVAVLIQV